MSHTYNLADMQDWMQLTRQYQRVVTTPTPRLAWAWTCGLLRDSGGYR